MVTKSSVFSGKRKAVFLETVALEKHERIARGALRDLILFDDALEKEMARITKSQAEGGSDSAELLSKMSAVKTQYGNVMNGFSALDIERQRHVLIAYADAVKDLMIQIRRRRPH